MFFRLLIFTQGYVSPSIDRWEWSLVYTFEPNSRLQRRGVYLQSNESLRSSRRQRSHHWDIKRSETCASTRTSGTWIRNNGTRKKPAMVQFRSTNSVTKSLRHVEFWLPNGYLEKTHPFSTYQRSREDREALQAPQSVRPGHPKAGQGSVASAKARKLLEDVPDRELTKPIWSHVFARNLTNGVSYP
jgi:hypothetical protein